MENENMGKNEELEVLNDAETAAEEADALAAEGQMQETETGAPAPSRAAEPVQAAAAGTGNGRKKGNNRLRSELLLWVRDIAIAVVVAFIITQFVSPTIVKEHSMLNTLNENDYLILWKTAYTFSDPDYGDIVVFQSNLDADDGGKKLLIKRVIGLPGDTIDIHDGIVYRNGEPLDEPYTKDGVTDDPTGQNVNVVVPEGELFLMGDNRLYSVDSRRPEVGTVDEDLLVGKAIFRLYPFGDFGSIYKNMPEESK